MNEAEGIIGSIRNTLRILVVMTIVLYIGLGIVAFRGYLQADIAHDSLCALRGDIESRVRTSEAYLEAHPRGAPGIPPQTIREGIINQRRTIATLSSLNCEEE